MSNPSKIIMPCLYTQHKMKKRKAWSDGMLHVFSNGQCLLYDSNTSTKITSGSSMDAVFLKTDELQQLMSGSETEVEMENHLVAIESLVNKEESTLASSATIAAASTMSLLREENGYVESQFATTQSSVPSFTSGLRVDNLSSKACKITPYDNCHTSSNHASQGRQSGSRHGPEITPQSQALNKTNATRSALAKPFKVPSFRPQTQLQNDRDNISAVVHNGYRNSAIGIHGRYRDQNADESDKTKLNDARYANVPGSAGNGRYLISNDEIDNLWKDDENFEPVCKDSFEKRVYFEPSSLTKSELESHHDRKAQEQIIPISKNVRDKEGGMGCTNNADSLIRSSKNDIWNI